MQCPACGNQNREGARFCDSCGFELAPGDGAPATADAGGQAAPAAPGQPAGTAAPPDAPRRSAGHNEFRRFLGRGARKHVYLARDPALDRDVAVALFDTEGLGEAALARARREMQAMERLGDPPHLVSVYATGEVDGRPYVVSRYMPGGNVRDLLAASGD